jgi:hypothetical protein
MFIDFRDERNERLQRRERTEESQRLIEGPVVYEPQPSKFKKNRVLMKKKLQSDLEETYLKD